MASIILGSDTRGEVTAATVDKESYFNACQLCRFLGYANAPAAIKELGLVVTVKRDSAGNITAAWLGGELGGERAID